MAALSIGGMRVKGKRLILNDAIPVAMHVRTVLIKVLFKHGFKCQYVSKIMLFSI